MSWQAVEWALDVAPVTDTTRTLVLVALAEKADQHGREARPGVELIARRARIGIRSAHTHLKALRDDGLIAPRDKRGPGGTVIYDLAMSRHAPSASDDVQPTAGHDVQPTAGRTCSPPHTNPPDTRVTPGTTPPRRSATAADLDARGDTLTKAWWESFDPRPSGSFVGFRTLIKSLLRAGWSDDQVAAAARACGPTFNRSSIERALRSGGPGRSAHGVGYRHGEASATADAMSEEWARGMAARGGSGG